MSPLKLTRLGTFAARHGALTPPRWWTSVLAEMTRLNEQGADYYVLLDERIRGLIELRSEAVAFPLMYPSDYPEDDAS